MRLPDLLVSEGVVRADSVVDAFEAQALYGGSFDTNLLELGVVDEKRLIPYLERVYDVHNRVDVLGEPAPDALARVPRKQAETHRVVPFRLTGRTLDVVVADPTDTRGIDEIAFATGLRLQASVAIEARVALHLYRGYGVPMPARLISVLQGKTWIKPLASRRAGGALALPPDTGRILRHEPDTAPTPRVEPDTVRVPRTKPVPVTGPAPQRLDPDHLRVPRAADESVTEQVLRVEPDLPLPAEANPPRSEAELAGRLARVSERDQIPPLALGFLSFLPRALLFRVRKSDIAGWDARGGLRHEAVPELSIPLEARSVFSAVMARAAPFEGVLPRGPVEESFVAHLALPSWPEQVVLAPILVKGRVVALLYGELPQPALAGARDAVIVAARHTAETLVRLILAKKAGA